MNLTKTIAAFAAAFPLTAVASAVADEPAPGFDAALAAELGADEYGMRNYVFVLLRTGPADAEISDPEQRRELFAGHFANMERLRDEGALVLAGPLDNEGDKRGVLVLAVDALEEAKAEVAKDPTVAAGIFIPEYSGFYSTAGLMKVNAIHEKVRLKKIN